MLRSFRDKVTMKFPKTFHLPDPVKEKLKQLSVFIGDKAEVVNKTWGMGEITFERAHLICLTFVLICILLGTYGMLRPEELYRDSIYRQKVLVALGFMTFMVFLVIFVVILDKLGIWCDRDDPEVLCLVLNLLVWLACFSAIILRAIKTEQEQEQEPTRNESVVFLSLLGALTVITIIVNLYTEHHFEKEKLKKGYKPRYEMCHNVPVKLYELV